AGPIACGKGGHMPKVICKTCGAMFEAIRATGRFCSGRCRVASHRLSVTDGLSVTTAEPEQVGVTPEAEPVSVTSVALSVTPEELAKYIIPAKPYIAKPFTFVQPPVCSDREL